MRIKWEEAHTGGGCMGLEYCGAKKQFEELGSGS